MKSVPYLRDPAEITRRSFEIIRAEADFGRFPGAMADVAQRLAHASGMIDILPDLAWSEGAAEAGLAALAKGAPIFADARMVADGISGRAAICTLSDERVPTLARALGTTRSAAAIALWDERLEGAIAAIGNAPTALFHLLDLIARGAPKPTLILGFPVGFVGAAELKEALIVSGLPFITLRGRRGGSAMAAAAVNALLKGTR